MTDGSSSTPATLVLPDGAGIAYHRYCGDGPGVIFCGGFMSDMTGTKVTALDRWCRARGQNFVRFDYQGHGASSGRFAEGTIGRWTDDAIAVLDQLTEGPQILVGSSMGGWIMLLMALARPERLGGLLGVACAADFTEHTIRQRLDPATRRRLEHDGLILAPACFPDQPPYPITLNFLDEARRHLLLNRPDLPIRCPVRLLHGMRDADVDWRTSLRVAERLDSDDVQVLLVKDGEHTMSRPSDLDLLTGRLGELLDRVRVA